MSALSSLTDGLPPLTPDRLRSHNTALKHYYR